MSPTQLCVGVGRNLPGHCHLARLDALPGLGPRQKLQTRGVRGMPCGRGARQLPGRKEHDSQGSMEAKEHQGGGGGGSALDSQPAGTE